MAAAVKTRVPGLRRQLFAAISATLAVASTGCWLAWPSVAIPKLIRGETAIVVTEEQVSWVVASLDLGNAASPLPMCYLADVFGRKSIIIVSGVMSLAASVMAFFASAPEILYLARFLAGIGKGITFSVVPMYLGEIASNPVRGALSSTFGVSLWIGTLFDYAVGPFVSFKIIAALTGVFPLIFFITFILCPDSPYFFLMKRREKDALKALKWLRKTSSSERFDYGEITEIEMKEITEAVEEEIKNKGKFYDLFLTPGNRHACFIIILLAFLQRLSGISPLLSYSSITLPTNDTFSPSAGVILFGVLLFIFCLSSSFFVDRLGRRFLLMLSSFGCFLANGISAIFYYFYHETDYDVESLIWVPYVCLMMYALFFAFGLGNVPMVLIGELFSTDVKSFAAALASIAFALASFVVNKLYITVEDRIGTYANYAFFSLIALVSLFFTYLAVFETKGKSFVEIQRILNKKV